MSTIASLYEYFGISASCTDSELRGAYRELLFRTHPDRNPQDRDATLKTQRLTQAYAELRAARRSAFLPSAEIESDIRTSRAGAEAGDEVLVTVFFSFSSAVDIEKIAGIKARLRASLDALRDQPSDPLRALQFIHAAFEGGRGDSDLVTRLLADPVLIDLASTLLFDAIGSERDARSTTLSRWARHLQRTGHISEAIQILEDAVSSGLASTALKDDLRSHHYSAAQYPHPTTGTKPGPEQRIIHLRRIIELGFDLDYIHKLLAEAYHDVGDDEPARSCLEHAYELNPNLSGAVRITRALGLPTTSRSRVEEAASHAAPRWTRPTEIPPAWQIRLWAECGMWEPILDFSHPGDYFRRLLPAARATLRTVATTLGARRNLL